MCNIQAKCSNVYMCYPTLNEKENEFDFSHSLCALCGNLFFIIFFLHIIRGCCAFCVYLYVNTELFHLLHIFGSFA
jgi:CRISPR/Cas system-associated protein Cas10 (large subunit of type III CRISPR-Cas system)